MDAHDKDDLPTNTYWGFESTQPLPAEGGVRARSAVGRFGKSWWAERWVRALTQVIDVARLARGRAYARSGQVLSLDVTVGTVRAKVQGTRVRPYEVRIEMRVLDDGEWARAIDALASQASYAAHLLNGEIPHDVEAVFHGEDLSLFPTSQGDLTTHCTCPDWVQPCKHVAAVYLLLGERLDEDPFLLFTLRGRTKEQIMAALRQKRASYAKDPTGLCAENGSAEQDRSGDRPLDACLANFWRMGDEIQGIQVRVAAPKIEMELLKMLGELSFAEDQELIERLEAIYRTVSRRALDVAFAH